MTELAFHPPPKVLFICGNRNHTTTMHAIARELPDCERWFTPYYCDDGTLLDFLRRAHLLEFVALGHDVLRDASTSGIALIDEDSLIAETNPAGAPG